MDHRAADAERRKRVEKMMQQHARVAAPTCVSREAEKPARRTLGADNRSAEVERLRRVGRILALHERLTGEARGLIAAKSRDYSGASENPLANFEAASALGMDPRMGVLLRTMDKLQRLRAFAATGTLAVPGEGVEDAVKDAINYLVFFLAMSWETDGTDGGTTNAPRQVSTRSGDNLQAEVRQ
jgi:hypothetical protein